MALTIYKLREVLDVLIRDGFGENETMISIPMGWCTEHNHEMRCYTEISSLDVDTKRNIVLLVMPELRTIIQAMSEAHEVH